MNFIRSSYLKHSSHWENATANSLEALRSIDPDHPATADEWRHRRMFESVRLFDHHSDWKWLTVGDGRYGCDAIRIGRMGIHSVLPSDIGDGALSIAKREGLIEDYQTENAEALSFADKSFDITFCKESLHHFPRPYAAIYEMIRVSRKAVILIEPRDYTIDRPPHRPIGPVGVCRHLSSWILHRLGRSRCPVPVSERFLLGDPPHYETVGNYMYPISSRELEKTALGLNLPAIALKGLNDHYLPEAGLVPPSKDQPIFRQISEVIEESDLRYERGEGSSSLLMTVLFISNPDEQTTNRFQQNGWLVKKLERNPYL